jgi:transposase
VSDTVQLADLADIRCKHSKETISKALEASWDADLLFALGQSYELYKFIQSQIRECEQKLEEFMKKYGCHLDEEEMSKKANSLEIPKEPGQAEEAGKTEETVKTKEIVRSKKHRCPKTAVVFDVESEGYRIFGVNLMRIPGISEGSVLKLIGELGHDFTEKFDSCKKFSRWANLAPNNKITGGKLISSKVPKRKNRVGQILREAANSAGASKTPLGDYYRRIRSRKGPMGAIVAIANKMSKIIYTMVQTKSEYDEKLIQTNEPEILRKKLKSVKKYVDKIEEQIKLHENLAMLQPA